MQREWFSGRVHPDVMRWMEDKKGKLEFNSVATVIEYMAKLIEPETFVNLTPGKYERDGKEQP